jgi:hypothetical protein
MSNTNLESRILEGILERVTPEQLELLHHKALGSFLSRYPNLPYPEVLDLLVDEELEVSDNSSDEEESLVVWEPFEYYEKQYVRTLIESELSDLINLVSDLNLN